MMAMRTRHSAYPARPSASSPPGHLAERLARERLDRPLLALGLAAVAAGDLDRDQGDDEVEQALCKEAGLAERPRGGALRGAPRAALGLVRAGAHRRRLALEDPGQPALDRRGDGVEVFLQGMVARDRDHLAPRPCGRASRMGRSPPGPRAPGPRVPRVRRGGSSRACRVGCTGNARQRTAAASASAAVRQATRAPAERPPLTSFPSTPCSRSAAITASQAVSKAGPPGRASDGRLLGRAAPRGRRSAPRFGRPRPRPSGPALRRRPRPRGRAPARRARPGTRSRCACAGPWGVSISWFFIRVGPHREARFSSASGSNRTRSSPVRGRRTRSPRSTRCCRGSPRRLRNRRGSTRWR